MRTIFAFLMLAAGAIAQVATGGLTIGGVLNAGSAISTRPHRSGTGSPIGRDNCSIIGETFFQTDGQSGSNVFGCTVTGTPGTWVAMTGVHKISGTWGTLDNTTALTAGTTVAACDQAQVAGTIFAWSAQASPSTASVTFKIWKLATSTAIPTVSNSINTSGIGYTGGGSGNTDSTTLTDFTTTAVAVGDKVCVNLSAVSGSPIYAAIQVLFR